MRRNIRDWDTSIGEFFEAGRAYTTQTGYLAPELQVDFACTAATLTPAGEPIAFGFVRAGKPEWTPTGFGTDDFTGHAWNPARPPEWLTTASATKAVPASPLAQAADAKRARDLGGELGALMAAEHELTSAPWYPVRRGDLVHVHYEAGGEMTPFGETYVVGDAGGPGDAVGGLLSMILLSHTLPDTVDEAEVQGMTGCFAVEAVDDPLYGPWFEAGPHRLTIVRDGQVVHDGAARHAGAPADAGVRRRTLARAVADAKRYLQRGEPELALARLRSPGPLPPCGAPGIMPDHQPCARPRGHGGAHCDDPDFREGPHECPALPEELHAVVTVDADCADVHFGGLYEDREVAVDAAAGHEAYVEEHTAQSVRDYEHGVDLVLPDPRQFRRTGVQMAVVVPLRVLPDPRAEDEWAAEGRATCMEPDPDYGRDLDDE